MGKVHALMFCLVVLALTAVASCGDIFARNKHIVGNYYLTDGEEQGNYFIAYSSSFIEKIPRSVISYGYSNSLLVAKVRNQGNEEFYYVINMSKDKDIAKESDFRIGPLTKEEFYLVFSNRKSIQLISVFD